MRNRKSLLVLSVLAVVSLMLSSIASAEVINTTTGKVLFYDNYESAPAVVGAYSGSSTVDADPVGVVCRIPTAVTESALYNVQVTNYGTPGAYEGDNYLRLNSGGNNYNVMYFADQSTQGDQISLAWMINIDGTSANAARICLTGSAYYIEVANTSATAISTCYPNPSGSGYLWQVIPGLTYVQKTWQKWQLDYKIGDSTYAMSVSTPDGSGGWTNVKTASGIPMKVTTGLDTMVLNQVVHLNQSGRCHMDEYRAVPEPSCVVLLASGLIGLLCYAWRKRN